jgi:hypothetical protein
MKMTVKPTTATARAIASGVVTHINCPKRKWDQQFLVISVAFMHEQFLS